MADPERPTAESNVRLHDPGPMRAMAHPMRLRIIGLLRMEGPATVGMLAATTGESAGSVSYHMATLAKHGFVEEAPELARDRRERWWRAAHEMTSWDAVEFLDDPARHAASEALRRTVLESYHRELLAALDAEATLEPEWIASSDSSDGAAHLTLEEFRELAAELAAVREKWWARRREPADGTRLVRWITHVFPRVGG
ncbi:helix-turn-helix domain-containing protein [Agromyces sp. SYSU T00266]|uniref:helix-turn-helix domain-containing protein n=1 Tax=Agromyces zhanjiangensis TaxID=3158562 RepID=UPI00339924D8